MNVALDLFIYQHSKFNRKESWTYDATAEHNKKNWEI
jgi:hypothetical protein